MRFDVVAAFVVRTVNKANTTTHIRVSRQRTAGAIRMIAGRSRALDSTVVVISRVESARKRSNVQPDSVRPTTG